MGWQIQWRAPAHGQLCGDRGRGVLRQRENDKERGCDPIEVMANTVLRDGQQYDRHDR